MKIITCIIIFFTFSIAIIDAQNTVVSGIINSYAEGIQQINYTHIKVNQVSIFQPGDTVFIYQAQGATTVKANNNTFGDIISLGNAGNYDFSIIQSIDAQNKILTLTCPLQNMYNDSMFQVVRVRNFVNATVAGTLTCPAWDGKKGGVLVLFVHETLTLYADIDVSFKGFRGANSPQVNTLLKCSNQANIYNYFYTQNGYDSAGLKGEGVSKLPLAYARGRGKNANGGGGGNGINSAGGGGGNGGIGGDGGKESYQCPVTQNYGGIGGTNFSISQTINGGRLFFGGGGGTGTFEQYPNDVSNGGNGGGIAIIIAKNIVANSYSIKANGETVTYVTQNESAGGGGGGGTIVLSAFNISGNLSLSAFGGNGGSSNAISSCRGSGGGGGGGVVYYSTPTVPPINISKGYAGNACSQYKGTDGTNGIAANNFLLRLNCLLNNNQIQANQQICPGIQPNLLTGTSSPLYFSYLWQYSTDYSSWSACPGTNNQPNYQPPILTQTTYYRRLVYLSSGTTVDTSNIVTITVAPIVTSFNVTHVTCYGGLNGQVQTSVTGGTLPYTFGWNNGVTSQNLNNVPAGIYFLSVSDSKGCVRYDTVVVNQPPQIQVNIFKTDVTCYGLSDGFANATVTGGVSPYNYIWSNGTNMPAISNVFAGTYYLTITDANNCQLVSYINIDQPPPLAINYIVSSPTCEYSCNGSITANVTGGTPPYQITPANLSNLCPGVYNIVATDNNSCIATTTVSLSPQTNIQNNIIQTNSSAQVCYHSTIAITGTTPTGSGVFNFLWQSSFDGINWTSAPLPNSHPNYNWYVDAPRYFRRIVIGNGCADTSNVLHFSVIQLTNQIQTADTIYCQNDSIMPITGTIDTSFTYLWQVNYGSGWQNLSAQTPSIFPSNQYTQALYRRIVSSYGCYDTSNTIQIIIINAIAGNTIFIEDTLIYAQYCTVAEGDIGGQNSIPNVSTIWQMSLDSLNWSTVDTSLIYHFYITDYSNQFYYYRRIIQIQGCSDTSNVVVVEILPPLLNIIESNHGLSSIVEVCSGQMLALGSFINQPSGGNNQYTYLWIYSTSSANWMPAIGINNQKNYLTPAIWDTVYFARIIESGACLDTSNIISVYPIYLPSNEINTTQTDYCYGQSILPIEESVPTQGFNVSYQWQMLVNNQWQNIAGANQPVYVPNYIIGSTSYRRNVFKNNCSSSSNIITINCNPQKNVTFEHLNNDSICKTFNSSINIHVHIEGNGPWNVTYSINGINYSFNQYSNDSIFSVSPLQQNYYEIYLVQVTDSSNCSNILPNDTIRIWAFNSIAAHSSSMELCGLTATLQAQPPVEGIGRWILPPTMTCNNVYLHNAQVYSSQYGTFPIIWEVTNGPCYDTNQTYITFYEAPSQPYAGDDQIIYDLSQPVYLNASNPNVGVGTWTVISGQASFVDIHSPHTQITGLAEGDNILRWSVVNGVCPQVYDDVLIKVYTIVVPEGFSPNGDGINDFFEINGIDDTYQLSVFNRWGNLVYESKPYLNNWNGKDKGGNDLPDDTYFYMLYKGNKLIKSGYLILKR
ncbi:MAG: gliding motility-associated C-terminal domain-containing protein [Bacteroidales bacterium]|nr:gliding motility-associated C-terminal domain-containing protein [Bacteroidales bacterium]